MTPDGPGATAGADTAGQGVPACPACGARDMVPVVYGTPDQKTLRDVQAGRLFWAGSALRDGGPTAYCQRCTYQWHLTWTA